MKSNISKRRFSQVPTSELESDMTVELTAAREVVGTRSKSSRKARKRLGLAAQQLGFFIAVLALWQLLIKLGVLNSFFVSNPISIAKELFTLYRQNEIWNNVRVTLEESLLGYVAGMVVGAALGFVLGLTPRIMAVLDPFVNLMNAVPRFALAPLFILWFGIGLSTKVVLSFTLVVIIAFVNTLEGSRSVNAEMLQMMKIFRASRWQQIRYVKLPSCAPWIAAAGRLSIGYAVGGAIVGELFASQAGLGYLLSLGQNLNNSSEEFAALVLVAAIAWILTIGAGFIEHKLTRWRTTS